jgi:hypothetical protein
MDGALCDVPEQHRGRGAQIQHNLGPKGLFFMVNHGTAESDLAAQWCDAAGLRLAGRWSDLGPLNGHRLSPPVLSW